MQSEVFDYQLLANYLQNLKKPRDKIASLILDGKILRLKKGLYVFGENWRRTPFFVRTYIPEDLFAGKMHAVLCRFYKVRVKGRDWDDFIWYVNKGFHLNLAHLESRMRQSGHYSDENPFTKDIFLHLLKEKIRTLNINAAKEDIKRFIPNPRELDEWSTDFFISLIHKIQFHLY